MLKKLSLYLNRFIPFTLFLLVHGMAFQNISSDTLKVWMDKGTKFDFLMIDVRPTVSTIIASDKCLPYHIPLSGGELEKQMEKVPKNLVLVFYCKTGKTSDEAAETLEKSAYKVFSLTGGISKWDGPTKPAQDALPVSSLPKVSRKANPDFNNFANIDNDTLKSWMTAGAAFDFMLIDIRDDAELTAVIANDTCRPYHLSWNKGDLEKNLGKLTKDKPVVLYCRSGNRSLSASALAGKAGLSVHNLIGGMRLWNGPTRQKSSVRPLTDLPASSMAADPDKMASFLFSERPVSGAFTVGQAFGKLRISWPVDYLDSPIDGVEILSAAGKSRGYGSIHSGGNSVILPVTGSGIHYILLKHHNDVLAVKPALLPSRVNRP